MRNPIIHQIFRWPVLWACLLFFAVEAFGEAPVHKVGVGTAIREWLVAGPFPNPSPEHPSPGNTYRLGFLTDYMAAVGGERNPRLAEGMEIGYAEAQGAARTVRVSRAALNRAGRLDFKALAPEGYGVFYAVARLQSDREQTVQGLFGSNDSGIVWLNGTEVVRAWRDGGRGCVPGDDVFSAVLQQGLNTLVVKVEDVGGAGWECAVEILDDASRDLRSASLTRKDDLRAFQALTLSPADGAGHVRRGAQFPEMAWGDAALVARLFGDAPLRTTWYAARKERGVWQFKKMARPSGAGIYTVYTERPGGEAAIRRAQFFYFPAQDVPLDEGAVLRYIDGLPIAEAPLQGHSISHASKQFWRERLALFKSTGTGDEWTAALFAAVAAGNADEEPMILHGDVLVALRGLMEGRPAGRGLARPAEIAGLAAPVLRAGSAGEAGVAEPLSTQLHGICTEWYDASQEPFAVLVARRGVIVLHGAFGPITVDTPLWMASITKLITGVHYGQYLDQGLLPADAPLPLPDFPAAGEKVITPRMCLTHCTGLSGHGEWGGIHNPYFDNVVLSGLEYLRPGRVREYTGMGYTLLARAMEETGGKSFLRSIRERLFLPLGMIHTTIGHPGSISFSTPMDMARLGQMLLNRGAYGDLRFFSEETFEQLLPRPLAEFYPGIRDTWGLGITALSRPHPQAGRNGVPKDAMLLGPRVFGHGAASSAVFGVDPDNELVVVQTRSKAGEHYDKFLVRFLETLAAGLL